jgi:hypothetical protein
MRENAKALGVCIRLPFLPPRPSLRARLPPSRPPSAVPQPSQRARAAHLPRRHIAAYPSISPRSPSISLGCPSFLHATSIRAALVFLVHARRYARTHFHIKRIRLCSSAQLSPTTRRSGMSPFSPSFAPPSSFFPAPSRPRLFHFFPSLLGAPNPLCPFRGAPEFPFAAKARNSWEPEYIARAAKYSGNRFFLAGSGQTETERNAFARCSAAVSGARAEGAMRSRDTRPRLPLLSPC